MPTLLPPAYPRLPPLLTTSARWPSRARSSSAEAGESELSTTTMSRSRSCDVSSDATQATVSSALSWLTSTTPVRPGWCAGAAGASRGLPVMRRSVDGGGPLARARPCSHGRNTTGGSVAWPQHEAAGEETSPEQGSGQQVGPLRDTVVTATRTTPSNVPWRFCGRLLRLHAGGDCLRPDDDGARAGPVLRRHVAIQVRAQHDDDVVHRRGDRRHPVRRGRLVDGLRRGRHVLRQPVRAALARRRHHRQLHLRDVPDDLRDHHRRADQRRGRGPAEVLGLGGLPAAVGRHRLLPDGAHGVQLHRRLAHLRPDRRAGLRRRHRGPHQRRRRGPGARAAARQAHRLAQGPDASAQPDADHARRGHAVAGLVRLQRRLHRLRHDLRRGPRRLPLAVLLRDRSHLRQHHAGHLRRDPRLAAHRAAAARQGHLARCRVRHRGGPRRHHPGGRRRRHRGRRGHRPHRRWCLRLGRQPEVQARVRRLARRGRRAPGRRHHRHRAHRRLLHLRGRRRRRRPALRWRCGLAGRPDPRCPGGRRLLRRADRGHRAWPSSTRSGSGSTRRTRSTASTSPSTASPPTTCTVAPAAAGPASWPRAPQHQSTSSTEGANA